ncbi:lactoylglutathione lyase [Kangiella marina]|uniref:lactoylglutathione lyase n=1 Tax=Kangiella marina TaxID=1079178 RepID=A0ABP8IDL3_9GAMM
MSGGAVRLLHTMLRVGDLEKSIHFYSDIMGMELIRKHDYESGRFTLAFLGYGPEKDNTVLELTYNWDTDSYEKGEGFGHIAIAVDDVYAACEKIRDAGGTIVREPGPMKHGTTVLAFVEDPDGYKIELLEDRHNA